MSVFLILTMVFFALGWQIGEINLVSFVTNADEALPALGRIAWPWEKAIEYDLVEVRAGADIEIPCSDLPPEENVVSGDEPTLISTPTNATWF